MNIEISAGAIRVLIFLSGVFFGAGSFWLAKPIYPGTTKKASKKSESMRTKLGVTDVEPKDCKPKDSNHGQCQVDESKPERLFVKADFFYFNFLFRENFKPGHLSRCFNNFCSCWKSGFGFSHVSGAQKSWSVPA